MAGQQRREQDEYSKEGHLNECSEGWQNDNEEVASVECWHHLISNALASMEGWSFRRQSTSRTMTSGSRLVCHSMNDLILLSIWSSARSLGKSFTVVNQARQMPLQSGSV